MQDGRRLGTRRVASIDTAFVDQLFERLLFKEVKGEKIERRTTVNHAMKTARSAWNAISRAHPGLLPPRNPFEKMGLQSSSRETSHATFAELAAFRTKAIEMGYPSLATSALIGWELLQREAHIFIGSTADHYRPPSHVYVINYKTSTGSWDPLFNAKGKALYPLLMAELDAIKELRPTGGLMLRRDGSSLPWFGKGETLTQVQRITKKIILAAGLRPELTFTSFGRHRGTTEARHIRAHGNAANEEGSVVVDGSYGALSARRRSGKARCANEMHQAACKTSERKVNVCQNENARLVRMERP
ncbi:hypothetical protein [Bradyrhizobium lupini]